MTRYFVDALRAIDGRKHPRLGAALIALRIITTAMVTIAVAWIAWH